MGRSAEENGSATRADRRPRGEGGEAGGCGGVAGQPSGASTSTRIITDAWIDRAITRYGQFLDLARKDPGATLVPTLDIDLICTYMLSPRDCRAEINIASMAWGV